ncbi:MAG TPA: radical SAM protein [Kofleriaceae bacterium]|jgi:uncharacterized protein|nr:radical SAM protein [Kofleriaceae bacterium]
MTEWVIEASTFCNLRCAYCYEWDGLSNPARMPLASVRKVLRAACDYHVRREAGSGAPARTSIIWHGGEPLTLPLDYLEAIFELAREVIAESCIDRKRITLAMQTNLYAVSDRALGLLKQHRIGLGVSFDLVRGVRRTLTGKATEDRVLRNLERLREAGIEHGAITVLATHTCPAICDIFDFWAARRVPWRVLPLFAGPPGRDHAAFAASEDELVQAMCRLFAHWMRARAQIVVKPLDEWLANVVRHMIGLRARPYDRRQGETVFVVRPDGNVLQVGDLGNTSQPLGNLEHQTIAELLASPAYAASLDRTDAITEKLCGGCRFRGGCDGYPAHASPIESLDRERCPVTHRVYGFIERHLQSAGLGAGELRALAEGAVS